MPVIDHDALRRHAIARTFFKPTTLLRAIQRLGFVQADPIRAPARAQDLILMHRVKDYRAGQLESRYARLAVEEDCLVNYGFLPREHLALMHPRTARRAWDAEMNARAAEVLSFIRERGRVHPQDVQKAFSHGRVAGYWGGELNASTQLLDGMHYRGQLRVVRRETGTRVYEAIDHRPVDDSPEARHARAAALLDLIVRLYAPLPAASLGYLTTLLNYGAPHLNAEARSVVKQARERYAHTKLDGVTWFWPVDENPASRSHKVDPLRLRFLAPFDPLVWDRRRFEHLWGWAYRFEAYTPPAQRTMGHYALPMLWGDRMIGWANLKVSHGRLVHELGFIERRPRDAAFRQSLDEALYSTSVFLGIAG
ncbi:DNA glycosylase AlkZ-like family protein [Roseateles amylovorans]|uniref:Winged helix DNA-binding domain-containing protein n=1 Tax=Roseateles amylovorans TaxID=2978473 RepID=A0ABY6B3B6_9BURK|nr:crosslink repair DNA glycosylase YcaQ family protein [Roseateles amylovorans]UXH79033.1 winged helix DNA-binding domain-containing protein [Roseateles amylovorans]